MKFSIAFSFAIIWAVAAISSIDSISIEQDYPFVTHDVFTPDPSPKPLPPLNQAFKKGTLNQAFNTSLI